MSIITRYVLIELVKVFSLSLTIITALILMFGVVKEAVSQNLGLPQILMLLPYAVPEAMRFAVPATILFATCSVYGRLASNNEVIAVKSMGLSPMVMVWPAFGFAFLVSLAAVWLNDVAVSWGHEGARRVVVGSVEEIAYGMLRTRLSYSSKQFSINVKSVEGNKLIRPIITFQADATSPPITVMAQEAELHADPVRNELTITCRNGTVEAGGMRAEFPGEMPPRVIPLDQASRKKAGGGPSELALRVIPEERIKLERHIREKKQRMAVDAAMALATGDVTSLGSEAWKNSRNSLNESYNLLRRLEMEPHRRWANGFSCLCFVLVGAPLAIMRRNPDFLSSFFACFGPIVLVYYPLLLGGVDQVKSGALPSYAVWSGNVLLALWGVWLLKRVIRY